jgi:hypothetical protein
MWVKCWQKVLSRGLIWGRTNEWKTSSTTPVAALRQTTGNSAVPERGQDISENPRSFSVTTAFAYRCSALITDRHSGCVEAHMVGKSAIWEWRNPSGMPQHMLDTYGNIQSICNCDDFA